MVRVVFHRGTTELIHAHRVCVFYYPRWEEVTGELFDTLGRSPYEFRRAVPEIRAANRLMRRAIAY